MREYLQVQATKDEAIKDELYEEAAYLHRRQTDYKAELSGPAESGSSLPVVDVTDIELIVEAWTGIPAETMGRDEKSRLSQLVRGELERLDPSPPEPHQIMAFGSDSSSFRLRLVSKEFLLDCFPRGAC